MVELEAAKELEDLGLLSDDLLSHLLSFPLLIFEVLLQLSRHIQVLALISRTLIEVIKDVYNVG